MANFKRKAPIALAAITTNVSTAAAAVEGFDYAIVAVNLADGTGDAVFKIQGALVAGGTKYDIETAAGVVAITETATGDFAYDVRCSSFVELYVTATDIAGQGYTLTASVVPYSQSVV